MAIRNIREVGDSVLRKKSKSVETIDQKILTLLDDMVETMYKADGVGLAAPQVGILKRVVVMDIGDGVIELINPEIIHSEGSQSGSEGCLSLPNESGDVTRPFRVTVRAYNRESKIIELTVKNFLQELFAMNLII